MFNLCSVSLYAIKIWYFLDWSERVVTLISETTSIYRNNKPPNRESFKSKFKDQAKKVADLLQLSDWLIFEILSDPVHIPA